MDVKELAKRLDSVTALLYELVEDIDENGLAGGKEELALAAALFHGFLDHAKEAKSYVDTEAINRIEYTPVPIETDAGTVEVQGGNKRKGWDHERLAGIVIKRILQSSIDLDTGERLLSPEEMIQEFRKYVGVSYWRVGALKDIGLTAASYCDETVGPKKVTVTKQEEKL
jgi:hypothetical protein